MKKGATIPATAIDFLKAARTPSTRRELRETLGVSEQTVDAWVNEAVRNGLLVEIGIKPRSKGQAGRLPRIYRLSPVWGGEQ